MCSFFFDRCADTLTRWATMDMFDTYNTHYNNYHVSHDEDTGRSTVTHRIHWDVYLVDGAFRCMCNTRRCWQQSYKGVLCIHALLTLITRMSTATTREEKEALCQTALDLCHPNWHRSTYATFEDPRLLKRIPQVQDIVKSTSKDPQMWQRFRDAAQYVPPEIIEQMILKIEVLALKTCPHETQPTVVMHARKPTVKRALFVDMTKNSDERRKKVRTG